jgi:hypothetical protein
MMSAQPQKRRLAAGYDGRTLVPRSHCCGCARPDGRSQVFSTQRLASAATSTAEPQVDRMAAGAQRRRPLNHSGTEPVVREPVREDRTGDTGARDQDVWFLAGMNDSQIQYGGRVAAVG